MRKHIRVANTDFDYTKSEIKSMLLVRVLAQKGGEIELGNALKTATPAYQLKLSPAFHGINPYPLSNLTYRGSVFGFSKKMSKPFTNNIIVYMPHCVNSELLK
jgi:hypothetical protein